MKILALTYYGSQAASARYRVYQYLPHLKQAGFEVTVHNFLDNQYLDASFNGKSSKASFFLSAYYRRIKTLLTAQKYDLIWLRLEFLPYIPTWLEFLFFSSQIPYIVDYDDAWFHRYDRHSSQIIRSILGSKIDRIMERSAAVIVGNSYLADRANRAGAKKVEILPTVIDLDRYHPSLKEKNGKFTIGWIGSPSTAKYLTSIQPALQEVCRDNRTEITLVGSGEITLDDIPVKIKSWSEITENSDIQQFDVGIMPLHDTPWEQGKCGFKLIQYMACALPTVGSPVGVNRDIIDDPDTGFHATTHEEWVMSLNTLKCQPELRHKMGLQGRHKVEDQYCLQVNAPKLVKIFQNVISCSTIDGS